MCLSALCGADVVELRAAFQQTRRKARVEQRQASVCIELRMQPQEALQVLHRSRSSTPWLALSGPSIKAAIVQVYSRCAIDVQEGLVGSKITLPFSRSVGKRV